VAGRAWRRVREFFGPKVADLADLFFVGVIVLSVVVAAANGSFVVTGKALAASLMGFSLCYLITSRNLRGREGVGAERMFIALATMVSGVWLYEIAYHYAWGASARALWRDLTWLSVNTPRSGSPYPLAWSLLMVSLAFVGARHMRVNRWFLLTAVLSLVTFALWLATGFPNYFNPQWWPSKNPSIGLIPLSYRHPTIGSSEAALVAFWGGVFNSATKILVSILPATLFLGARGRVTETTGGSWRLSLASFQERVRSIARRWRAGNPEGAADPGAQAPAPGQGGGGPP
jgi:hypothetical protein